MLEDKLKSQTSFSLFPYFIVASSVTLYLTSLYSYLLFHFLIELFTIVIAFGIFAIAWSSRHYVSNNFLLILGISLLFIGGLELLHTITFKGMGIINTESANTSTQLWVAARYLGSLSFLAALIFLKSSQSPDKEQNYRKPVIVITLFATTFTLILISIFYWKIFPTAYVEGSGLTQFKITSEYVVTFFYFLAIILLVKKRSLLDKEMANLILISLALKMAAELSFTLYVDVTDFANALGHIFRFLSYFLLYKAFLEIGLMQPYRFLFLDLQKSQAEYRAAQVELQERIEEHLAEAYEQLGMANRKIALLLEIGEHAEQNNDRQQVIEYIMNSAQSACHANVAMLYRAEDNDRFSLVRGKGLSEESIKQFRSVKKDDARFIAELSAEKKRINYSCQVMDGGCFNMGKKLSYFVAIPFALDEKLKGFMFLGFEKRHSMDSHELQFLDVFSIHATTALAQLKVISV